MMRSKRVILLIMLASAALACAIPGLPAANVDTASTSAVETIIAGLTQNVTASPTTTIAPSLTPTFTPTLIYLTPRFPSETPTLPVTPGTSTPTLEPTPTITLLPVVIRVTRPTNCRAGPGTSFEVVGSFLVGMKATVLGRDASSNFYYIPNPYVFTDYCWVSGKYAEFEGNPLLLPVVLSAPSPTVTGTALPVLDFKIQPHGIQTCNGAHWVGIEVLNESDYIFNSIKIVMQDKESNAFRSVTYNDFPYSINCETPRVGASIVSGDSEYVNGPRFDYNLRGTHMRTNITVCTEEDQKGICHTREFNINP